MNDGTNQIPAPDAISPLTRRNHPLRGIALLCLGVFVFSIHDIAVKWVSGTYPLTEVLFVRSATAAPLILSMVRWEAGLRSLLPHRLGLIFLRSLTLLFGYLVYYMGLSAMTLADAVALYSSVPLIIVALAGPLLGEQVGTVRWIAVTAGFVGVVIMLHPGIGIFEPAALLILLCAVLYSLGMIIGRRLGGAVPASVMAFHSNGLFLVAALMLGLVFTLLQLPPSASPSVAFMVRPWAVPSWRDLAFMMSCGVTAAIGIASLTAAYREAEANLVASFEYTGLLWAVLWGFVVWGDIPKLSTLAGAALIVAAGLAALWAGQTNRRPTRPLGKPVGQSEPN